MRRPRECERYGCPGRIRPNAPDSHEYCCLICSAVDKRFGTLRGEWDTHPEKIDQLDAEWDALGRVAVALTEFIGLVAEHRADR